jgi:hypothetical protein
METYDAGLMLAKWLGEGLDNHFTRIVLRTGQSGQVAEEQVIVCTVRNAPSYKIP